MMPSNQQFPGSVGSAAVLKDPVCGMAVDPATAAAQTEHDGTTYYFCCPHCAEKFKANPQTYLTGEAAEGRAHQAPAR